MKVSFDNLEELGETFMQVKGLDRQSVTETMQKLTNSEYIPKSYIELYQEKYKKPTTSPPTVSSEQNNMLNSFVQSKL